MLNKLRGFSKSKLAGVFVAIIIIPFVFWGMGSVFSGGNTNNIAKIDNLAISNKEFINNINQLRINPEYIKENLQNNILENLLSEMISNKILSMEIDSINANLNDEILAKIIQSNIQFRNEDGNFSRTKYEKFLLKNNTYATEFEKKIKNLELKNNLFSYIGGGIKTPYFLRNKIYIEENKKVELDYFNLENKYNKMITDDEVSKFIADNSDNLSEDYIDISYKKITPKILIDDDEYNEDFYKKIDEIENDILNDMTIETINKKFNLNINNLNNYKFSEGDEKYLEEIYQNRNKNNIQFVDKNDYFILYKVNKIQKKLPNEKDENFKKQVKKNIILKRKFEFNKELYNKIQNKELTEIEFIKLASGYENIKNIKISNDENNSFFDKDSNLIIKDLGVNDFVLLSNSKKEIFLAKIKNIRSDELINSNLSDEYNSKANFIISSHIYDTYDKLLSKKYNVKIFSNSLNRIKENFK